MSDVINVYKRNHTSQSMWNIRISYVFHQQASKSVRRYSVNKYWWSLNRILNNSKRRYYCVPWNIRIWQLLFQLPNRNFFRRFLALNSAPPVGTTPYPLMVEGISEVLTFWSEYITCPRWHEKVRVITSSKYCTAFEIRYHEAICKYKVNQCSLEHDQE